MALASSHAQPLSDEDSRSAARLLEALAIPPGPNNPTLGARVEHVLAPRDGPLSELVSEALQLPQGAAELLLRFGAIHTCPVPPPLPPAILDGMSAEKAARVQRTRQVALQRAGNSSQARTPQRANEDAVVTQHAYIRVHLHPKRFPAAYSVNWADRVVASSEHFVVVSKPAGVPAAPTVDNLLECAPACTAQALGLLQPLLLTHRLDQCTEGLLVLGRTKTFVARFNELMQRSSGSRSRKINNSVSSDIKISDRISSRDTKQCGDSSAEGGGVDSGMGCSAGQDSSSSIGSISSTISRSSNGIETDPRGLHGEERPVTDGCGVTASKKPASEHQPVLRKFYRATTSGAPPLGLLRHHLSIERRQPGLPGFTIAHEQPVEGSLLAELLVLEVQPIRLGTLAAGKWGTSSAYECIIELLTGRTHQIRAQLSAASCPLLGDSLYQPLACPDVRKRLFVGDPCHDLQASGRLLAEPDGGIGLQACKLLVADPWMGGSREQPAVFEAGTPWWRC